LIRKNKKDKKNITILVEEPELNLHPALQSKLTDLFHEANGKYNFKLIIETHSEYIIRRSQGIVNSEDYGASDSINPNPFKVFYYPLTDPIYEMKYDEEGKFINEFGPGFFDEARRLTRKLL
jgi:predicted ATPase